jgi:hypothetical protein
MGKKDAEEQKDKPLEKLTAKELREMGLGIGGISGVHTMNKDELIAAIKEARGIVDDKPRKAGTDVRSIKVKIRGLKEKRAVAKEAGKKKMADILRRRISNLKKKTRRTA